MNDTRKPGVRSSDAPKGQRRLGNRAIGERLRQMYEGVVDESIPDEFLKLLEEAEANERGNTGPDSSQDAGEEPGQSESGKS